MHTFFQICDLTAHFFRRSCIIPICCQDDRCFQKSFRTFPGFQIEKRIRTDDKIKFILRISLFKILHCLIGVRSFLSIHFIGTKPEIRDLFKLQGVSFRHGPVNLFVFPDLIYGADCVWHIPHFIQMELLVCIFTKHQMPVCGWDQMFRP